MEIGYISAKCSSMRFFTWLSKTLLITGRIDIGQYPLTEVFGQSDLGTGTILTCVG